jgi:hypothetical protein
MLYGEVIVIRAGNRTGHKLLVLEMREHHYELHVVLWRIVDGRRCTLVIVATFCRFVSFFPTVRRYTCRP